MKTYKKLDDYKILDKLRFQEIDKNKTYICIVGDESHEPNAILLNNTLTMLQELDYKNIRIVAPYYINLASI